jgi:hypothetical protein
MTLGVVVPDEDVGAAVSFLQPAIKTTVAIAKVANTFLVFIFCDFKLAACGGTDVNIFSRDKGEFI